MLKFFPRGHIFVGPGSAKLPCPIHVEVGEKNQSVLMPEGLKLTEEQVVLIERGCP